MYLTPIILDQNSMFNPLYFSDNDLKIQMFNHVVIAEMLLNHKGNKYMGIRMWKGYSNYLITVHLPNLWAEIRARGYDYKKLYKKYNAIIFKFYNRGGGDKYPFMFPHWLKDDLINSHRAYMMRRNDYYSFFGWCADIKTPMLWGIPKILKPKVKNIVKTVDF